MVVGLKEQEQADRQIEQLACNPLGTKNFAENNNRATLEDLRKIEQRTKKPLHTRPLTKIGLVAVILIPFFSFFVWFLKGQNQNQPKEQENRDDSVEQSLRAENQELLARIDELEMNLADIKQDVLEEQKKENAKPKPAPSKPTPSKPVSKPPPAPQPITTAKKQTVIPPPLRIVEQKREPIPEPTSAEKMQILQAIARSVVIGGNLEETSLVKETNLAESNALNNSSNIRMVGYQSKEVKKPNLQIKPNSELEASLLQEKPKESFETGTSINGLTLHPTFFEKENSSLINVEITESNTPLPVGSKLSIKLNIVDGITYLRSIQVQIGDRTIPLNPENWQIARSDGYPLIASTFNSENEPNRNRRINRNQTVQKVIRSSGNIYRSNDALTSVLLGTGMAIAEEELERQNRTIINSDSNQNFEINSIAENTSIKLYVIKPFSQILP